MINIDVYLGGSNGAAPPANQSSPLSSLSAQSFTAFLSEALSETLSKFGIDPNSFQVTLTNQPGQTPATSPNPATSPATASQPGFAPATASTPAATAATPPAASQPPVAKVPAARNL